MLAAPCLVSMIALLIKQPVTNAGTGQRMVPNSATAAISGVPPANHKDLEAVIFLVTRIVPSILVDAVIRSMAAGVIGALFLVQSLVVVERKPGHVQIRLHLVRGPLALGQALNRATRNPVLHAGTGQRMVPNSATVMIWGAPLVNPEVMMEAISPATQIIVPSIPPSVLIA